jgi:hypothetical protein
MNYNYDVLICCFFDSKPAANSSAPSPSGAKKENSMNNFRWAKNIFAFIFCAALLLGVFSFDSAAQCGGTYFKRSSTTLVPISGNFDSVADMTGDGIPDLVGLNENQRNLDINKLIILPGNGSGGFGAPIVLQVGAEYRISYYTVGDFDGDKFNDVLLHFFSPSGLDQVYRNNGNGTFTAHPLQTAPGNWWLYMMDVNNDGKGDMVSTVYEQLRHHLGNGDGTFQPPVIFAPGTFGTMKGDFNTDGKIDFIAGGNLIINQGNGVFSTISNAINLGATETVRDVRDYTGDGKPDVVTLIQANPAKLSLHTNLGNNSFQRTDYPLNLSEQTTDLTGDVITGNFNGNASPDILLSVPAFNKTLVFINDGAGTFITQTLNYRYTGIINWQGSFNGDFDSDGKTDSVVVSPTNAYNTLPRKLFNEITVTFQKNVCHPVGQTRLVDFDHSGATDFSYWTPADGGWAYLANSNVIPPSVSFYWGAGSFGDVPAPGDFDGDGTTDYAVYRNSTGVWWIYRSSDRQPAAVQFGLPGDKPVVGDYDGDSISDVAVWRPSDGNWYVLFMGTQQYTIVHWGQEGDKPVPADFDGDGKTDLAVFRPGNGTWYYLKSSDLNYVALQFGLGTDQPIPGDYDGDGKADIAVRRDSNSVMHLLRSYNLSYLSIVYGSAGDIQQPGDYDGDFVADLAVYRPSALKWSVFYSNQTINFGSGSVVPTASMLKIE